SAPAERTRVPLDRSAGPEGGADAGGEGVDVSLRRVPGGHPADLVACRLPVVEGTPRLERADHLRRKAGEQRVDRRGVVEVEAGRVPQLWVEALRHGVGMAGELQPPVVLQQREELRRDVASLRRELGELLA